MESGELDKDATVKAFLLYRNTPDHHTKVSLAQIIFGRALRDTLPRNPEYYNLNSKWILAREDWSNVSDKGRLSKN